MTVENLEVVLTRSGDNASAAFGRLASSIGKVKAPTQKVVSSLKSLSGGIKLSTTLAGKMAKSLVRIGFYRIIRTIVKNIAKAFKEGLSNAYQFSKGVSGALSKALDSLATNSLTMKNQLGSAFAGLLQAVIPILIKIINFATQAAEALSIFFGILNGSGKYLKANTVADSWDEATGAASAYKRTIMGFDEINKLDDNSSGGGSSLDYSSMFTEQDAIAPAWMQKIIDWFSEIKEKIPKEEVESLKEAFKDLGEALKDLAKSTGFQKILDFLQDLAAVATRVGIKMLTSTVEGLTTAIKTLTALFNGDIEGAIKVVFEAIDPDGVLQIVGLAAGFLTGGVPGAVAGWTVAIGVEFYIEHMKNTWNETELDEEYPFLSDQWIVQKIKKAKLTFKDGIKETGEEVVNLWDTLFVNPFLDFLDEDKRIADELEKFVTVTLTEWWEKIRLWFAEREEKMKAWQDGVIEDFSTAAGDLVDGIKNKLEEKWTDITSWFEEKWEDLKTWWSGLTLDGFKIKLPQFSISGTLSLEKGKLSFPTVSVEWYKDGGFPSVGDLFIAGEAGAELVSSHGGQTQVSNTDQIANSVEVGNSGVVSAIDYMANKIVSAINSKNTNVYLDSKQIRKGQERLERAMG